MASLDKLNIIESPDTSKPTSTGTLDDLYIQQSVRTRLDLLIIFLIEVIVASILIGYDAEDTSQIQIPMIFLIVFVVLLITLYVVSYFFG